MAGPAPRGDLLDALALVAFPVAAVDSEGRITWQNDAMRELVGDRVGRPFGEPVAADDRQRFRETVLQSFVTEESRTFELGFRTQDGRNLRAEASSVPLREGDRVVGVLGIFRLLPEPAEAPLPAAALTPRQREVLLLLSRGHSTDAIAARLGIAPETARNHIRQLLRRLGVHSRVEAVVRAHELGLVGK